MILSKRELRAGTNPLRDDADPDVLLVMINRLKGLEEKCESVIRKTRGQSRREAKRHLAAFADGRRKLEREFACVSTPAHFLDPSVGADRQHASAKAVAIAEAIESLSAGHRMRRDCISLRCLLVATLGSDAAQALVAAARADVLREVGHLEDPSRALGRLLAAHGPESPQPLVIAVTPTSVPSVAR